MYGVWAAFKKRLDAAQVRETGTKLGAAEYGIAARVALEQEVRQSFREFAAAGRVLSGCGGAISFATQNNERISDMKPDDAFASIFGDEQSSKPEKSYKFDKAMYCVVCQAPPTQAEQKAEAKKMCGPCGICKGCDTKIRAKNGTKSSFAATA
jgi:hypothetical protein